MADILIRGMEMPKTCGLCKFCLDDSRICNGYCMFFHRRVNMMERDKSCPIVPLPEGHGRLIDADALERVCKEIADCEWNKKTAPYSWEYAYNQFIGDEISDAPTIVPAEGGTENG
jgi:hypothetical protein